MPDSPNSKFASMCGNPLTKMNTINVASDAATAATHTILMYLSTVQPLPLLTNTGAERSLFDTSTFIPFFSRYFLGLRASPMPKLSASTITKSTLPVAINACRCSPVA